MAERASWRTRRPVYSPAPATIHGGQESTILASMIPMLHLGMVFVGTPYGQNPHILTTEAVGGSPYGPSTIAGTDGSRQPVDDELLTCRNLGDRVAQVAGCMAEIRARRAQGQQARRRDLLRVAASGGKG